MTLSFAEWLLQEGVFDSQAFKAVIMFGGPGTGKTHITKYFTGFKPVNSDSLFEKYMTAQKLIGGTGNTPPERSTFVPSKTSKINANLASGLDWEHEDLPPHPSGNRGYNLGQWPGQRTGPIDIQSDELLRRMKRRAGAYTNALSGILSPGTPGRVTDLPSLDQEGQRRTKELGFEPHPFRGNPLILETTGRDRSANMEDLPALLGLGYDVYGVMVNVLHIDSAIRSNAERSRRLRDGLVVEIHQAVERNLSPLQTDFQAGGGRWFQIDVDRTPPLDYQWLTDEQLNLAKSDPEAWAPLKEKIMQGKWGFLNIVREMGRIVERIQTAPLTNKLGIEWLRREQGGLPAHIVPALRRVGNATPTPTTT